MNLNQIHNVYFIGIGGIGMSALARYFSFLGKEIAGYDKTETELTKSLVKEGIEVHYKDGNTKKAESLLLDKETSQQVFERTGTINHIEVQILECDLR